MIKKISFVKNGSSGQGQELHWKVGEESVETSSSITPIWVFATFYVSIMLAYVSIDIKTNNTN